MMRDINGRVKKVCKLNVVGALYEDTGRLFYSFSRKDEWLRLNPQMYDFLCRHKVMVEKLNYFEWARFLEKVNDEERTARLLSKIDESSRRSNLSAYRQMLYDEFEQHNCFYCGRRLQEGKAHVDHFIPWSFIKDDNLWNFVLACPECNTKKNDKLPDRVYLDKLLERNRQLAQGRGSLLCRGDKLTSVYNWARVNGYDRLWSPTKVKDIE